MTEALDKKCIAALVLLDLSAEAGGIEVITLLTGTELISYMAIIN